MTLARLSMSIGLRNFHKTKEKIILSNSTSEYTSGSRQGAYFVSKSSSFDEITLKSTESRNVYETSKRNLKKCRFCAFKKRTCVLNPYKCKARFRVCSKCYKSGHL